MEPWDFKPSRDLGLPPKERWKSLKRESGLWNDLTHKAALVLMRTHLRLWHRLQVEGREFLPAKPPYILVANHSSHLDALALTAAVPWKSQHRVHPLAAGDTFFEKTSTARFIALTLNALPLWRRRLGIHDMQELRERLLAEEAIYIVFPEGTRSRTGKMVPFRPGIGMLVAGTEVPVVPCHITGAYEAFPPETHWPKRLPVRLRIGTPLTFADRQNVKTEWVKLAGELEAAVQALANENAPR